MGKRMHNVLQLRNLKYCEECQWWKEDRRLKDRLSRTLVKKEDGEDGDWGEELERVTRPDSSWLPWILCFQCTCQFISEFLSGRFRNKYLLLSFTPSFPTQVLGRQGERTEMTEEMSTGIWPLRTACLVEADSLHSIFPCRSLLNIWGT